MIRASIVAFFLIVVQMTFAHDLDLTLIKLTRTQGGTTIEVTTPLSRLVKTSGLRFDPTGPELDKTVRERLGDLVPGAANLEVDSQADLLTWSGELAKGREYAPMRFDDSTPAARTILATYSDGRLQSELVLDAERPQVSSTGMLKSGVEHIFTGLDHILFVVGLALLGGGWKQIVKALTAFTVAHSVTLFAAAFSLIHGNPKIVEPLIALSIVALAVEGLWRQNQAERSTSVLIGIAFGFGLVHGLGFAGGLAELGIQGDQLARTLISFSLGIEIGQFLVFGSALGLLALVSKQSKERSAQLSFAASVTLGMIGSFWLVERLVLR